MKETVETIGNHIIDREGKIGEIIDIVKMSGDEEFFKVIFPNFNSVNFYSKKVKTGYRIVSSKADLQTAIEIFKKSQTPVIFDSTQEKINYYKKNLKASDIHNLARHLSILNSEDEIHSAVKSSFNKALTTLITEISYVFKIKYNEARKNLGLSTNPK